METAGTFDPSGVEQDFNKPEQGIAQSTTRARKNKFQERFGVPFLEATLTQQLDFLVLEMPQREPYYTGPNPSYDKTLFNAGQKVLRARTPEDAAKIFMIDFERPADKSQNAQNGRARMSREIYNFGKFRSGSLKQYKEYEQMRPRMQ